MQKLSNWLDEPGKRFFRIVVFQIALSMFLIVAGMVIPIDGRQAMILFWHFLSGITLLTALALIVIGCSWPLMSGLSILAFIENLLIIPLASVGGTIDGMVSISLSVIPNVMWIAFAIFMTPVMFIVNQAIAEKDKERARIPSISP